MGASQGHWSSVVSGSGDPDQYDATTLQVISLHMLTDIGSYGISLYYILDIYCVYDAAYMYY